MKVSEFLTVSVFYLFLTLIFFHKVFLGLLPLPTDLIVGGYYPWLSYKYTSAVGVPVKNPKLSDAVSIFYPLKSFASDIVKAKDIPLWNPHMFGGYPLFTNPTLGLFFPTSVFYLFLSSPTAWTLQTMSQPFLAAVFMYLLLRHLKLPLFASIFGGTAYGFGGFSILWMEWNSQATTSLLLPILILLEDKYILEKKSKWGILLAVFFCFQILAGYLPIIPLTLVCIVTWYLFFGKSIKVGYKLFLYLFLGACLSAFFLVPLGELVSVSQRTSETLGAISPFILPQNLVNLVAPDFFGNDATYNFWGQGDHMDSTIYVGIGALVFALVGVSQMFEKRHVKFAIFLTLLILLLSINNPISAFVYKLGLWGGSSITMNRTNFISNFSLAILTSFGFSIIHKSFSKLSLKPVLLIICILLGLALGVYFYKVVFAVVKSSAHVHLGVALRNLIWPTALAIAVFLVLFVFKKIKGYTLFLQIILIFILVADLFRLGWKFNTFSSPKYIYPNTPVSDFLKQYPHDRFVAEKDVFPANMWVPFQLSTVTGYDSIYPKNAAKLIAVANSNDTNATPQTRWGLLENFSGRLLDASNVRFLVTLKKDSAGKVSSKGNINTMYKSSKYRQVFEDSGIVVLENTKVLPRTFLTNEVVKLNDNEALTQLINSEFQIDKVAITENFELNQKSELPLVYESDYKPTKNAKVEINTTANQDAFLVVLDSYYPGWKVFVDNKESTIYRTNYNFRGVFLKKGTHKVEFVYSPKSLKYGLIISSFSVLVIFIISKRPIV